MNYIRMESLCEICEKNPITIKCLDCTKNVYCCKTCFELSHASDSKRAHKTGNASVKETTKFLCSVHYKEREYVCKTCKKTICQDCFLVGSDKGHNVISFKEVTPWVQELCNNSLKGYNETFEKLNNLKKGEIAKIEKCKVLAENSKAKIEKTISKIIEIIMYQKEKAFKLIDTIYSEFLNQFEQIKTIEAECEEIIKSIKNFYNDFDLKKTPDICDKEVQYKTPDISAMKQKVEEKKKAISAKPYIKTLKTIESQVLYFEKMNPLSNWKVDRCYLSKHFVLSEDGLTLANPTSSDWPAAIGDTIFNKYVLAYEITFSGLGKSDGFGIIEFEKFKEIFNKNKDNPQACDSMIGITQGCSVKNITVVNESNLISGKKYIVVADFDKLVMTIQGPECSFKANLKQGVNYVPCFSCCYSTSKITIKPI